MIFLLLLVLSPIPVDPFDSLHTAHLEKPRGMRHLPYNYDNQKDTHFWFAKAQELLLHKNKQQLITGKAKNVILFLGDGMSIATLTATRIYIGQLQGKAGEETELSIDHFPITGLSKTYCVDRQVADSACSATAYFSGVKANIGTIGVNGRVHCDDCQAMRNHSNQVDSIIKWSQDAGKATGIVTTTRITHASPAGGYAHIANRNWEDDSEVEKCHRDPLICDDIAEQLVKNYPGKNLKVILGGGRKHFRSKDHRDESKRRGKRNDGVDLIRTWMKDKENRGVSYKYVWNKQQLRTMDLRRTDFLLGLFAYNHLPFLKESKAQQKANIPSLEEMTRVAIKKLSLDENGYFLFVEGGRIDHAHHGNIAHLALDETKQFSEAIKAAVELTNERDTLIIVTSDHSHSMTISGYPARGNGIFDFAGRSNVDNLYYTTMNYATGDGYRRERTDLEKENTRNTSFKFPATVPLRSASHAGEDVPVFARGPWSHLFSGTYEQNYIPHAMAFASCVGPGSKVCDKRCNFLW